MANNDEMPPLGDSWCKTDLKTRNTEGTFTWTISGLGEHIEDYAEGESVMSKQFTIRSPDGKETKWILEFFPRCKSSTNYFQIVVHSKNKFDVKTKIQITIMTVEMYLILVMFYVVESSITQITIFGFLRFVLFGFKVMDFLEVKHYVLFGFILHVTFKTILMNSSGMGLKTSFVSSNVST